MKYTKKFTVKVWKRFEKKRVDGDNDHQFFNFTTQRMESQITLTMQEILLSKYKIILTDHVTSRKAKNVKGEYLDSEGKPQIETRHIDFKGVAKSILSSLTVQNFDKGMKTFDKGMAEFSKEMDALSKGLGGNKKNNKKNLDMLWGKPGKKSKSSKALIWNKPSPKKRKTKRKSKSDKWDQDEANLTKIWGKKK